jgi:hypothetical protein
VLRCSVSDFSLSAATAASGVFVASGVEEPVGPSGPTEVPVASVEITPASHRFTSLYLTVQLTAVAKDAQGNTLQGKAFT